MLFLVANLSLTHNVVDRVYSVRTSRSQSFQQVLLHLPILPISHYSTLTLPIYVICYIARITHLPVRKVLDRALAITPQGSFEHTIAIYLSIMLNAVATVVVQDVRVTPCAVALIIECGWLLARRA